MNFNIKLNKPPTGTAQQKGASVIHGKIHFYEKACVTAQRDIYRLAIRKYAPEFPLDGPITLKIAFIYPELKTKKLKDRWEWVTTKPDLDNLVKLFIDALADEGFFRDDSQIASLHLMKFRSQGQTDMRIDVDIDTLWPCEAVERGGAE